jgi:hypothetical protein
MFHDLQTLDTTYATKYLPNERHSPYWCHFLLRFCEIFHCSFYAARDSNSTCPVDT